MFHTKKMKTQVQLLGFVFAKCNKDCKVMTESPELCRNVCDIAMCDMWTWHAGHCYMKSKKDYWTDYQPGHYAGEKNSLEIRKDTQIRGGVYC